MESFAKLCRLTPLAAVIFAAVCSCAPDPSTTSTPEVNGPAIDTLDVVTTSNIVGDWGREVGGDRVNVFSLLPINADPHTFHPGARDTTKVAEADIVFTIGLGLEAAWFRELVENASTDATKVVALGESIEAIEFAESDENDSAHIEDEHEHGGLDPHFWLDPLRVKAAVSEISIRLASIDPEGAELYQSNERDYNANLDALHEWIQSRVGEIPPNGRRLVTSHDAFGYFANRYGFEVVGAVIPGVTTEREPSAQEMAALVDEIRDNNVRAIFTEASLSDRLARRISEEAGVQVITGLRTGSLGEPGSDGDTYVKFMRTNVDIIVEALK